MLESVERKQIRHAATLCHIARGKYSLAIIKEIIRTAPKNEREKYSQQWQNKSFCWKILLECDGQYDELPPSRLEAFNNATTFWLDIFPYLDNQGTFSWLHNMELQKSKVLTFPIQDIEDGSFIEVLEEARRYSARLLNLVAIGKINELPYQLKKELRLVNKCSVEFGLRPLEGDF